LHPRLNENQGLLALLILDNCSLSALPVFLQWETAQIWDPNFFLKKPIKVLFRIKKGITFALPFGEEKA
jgi:hypothetical protein